MIMLSLLGSWSSFLAEAKISEGSCPEAHSVFRCNAHSAGSFILHSDFNSLFFSFKMGEFSQQLDMSFSSKYLEDVIPKVADQSNFDSNAYYEKVNSWS